MTENKIPPYQTEVIDHQAGIFRRMLGGVGLGARPGIEQSFSAPADPFEYDNFVSVAPTLTELSEEAGARTSTFKYLPEPAHITSDFVGNVDDGNATTTELSEGEGISGFFGFLDQLDTDADKLSYPTADLAALLSLTGEDKVIFGEDKLDRPTPDGDVRGWIHRKVDALRATSFLGSNEFAEATKGIADHWKSFLARNPNTQIYLPAVQGGKSSSFVVENILRNFTDTELEGLRGRIVGGIDAVVSGSEDLKIILVDDSMMSGDQMRERVKEVWRSPRRMGFNDSIESEDRYQEKYGDCLEINLLIGDEQRIEHGDRDTNIRVPKAIPVKAYYKAPASIDAKDKEEGDPYAYSSRISGIHSSVDVHFSLTVSNIISILNKFEPGRVSSGAYRMPPLTNIVRPYRSVRQERTIGLLSSHD